MNIVWAALVSGAAAVSAAALTAWFAMHTGLFGVVGQMASTIVATKQDRARQLVERRRELYADFLTAAYTAVRRETSAHEAQHALTQAFAFMELEGDADVVDEAGRLHTFAEQADLPSFEEARRSFVEAARRDLERGTQTG
ncbi:hypothetical protein ACFYW6_33955 [Streptomyces sp. NPDC002659]|uniref:hypothetical protein n=1 Tax=Streptomyces sp. NPDC002659 TaxID=3364656 RepID=UPI0036BB2C9D